MGLHIDHFHAVAVDLDKSIAFYTQILGFRLLRRVAFGAPDARRELAYIGLGDMTIELVPPADPANPLGGGTGARPFALRVDDMAETIRELEAKGVEVDTQPRAGFSFKGQTAVIRDPSGLALELRGWHPDDGPHYPAWTPEREDVVLMG
jgi:lactoylglutathione lyase